MTSARPPLPPLLRRRLPDRPQRADQRRRGGGRAAGGGRARPGGASLQLACAAARHGRVWVPHGHAQARARGCARLVRRPCLGRSAAAELARTHARTPAFRRRVAFEKCTALHRHLAHAGTSTAPTPAAAWAATAACATRCRAARATQATPRCATGRCCRVRPRVQQRHEAPAWQTARSEAACETPRCSMHALSCCAACAITSHHGAQAIPSCCSTCRTRPPSCSCCTTCTAATLGAATAPPAARPRAACTRCSRSQATRASSGAVATPRQRARARARLVMRLRLALLAAAVAAVALRTASPATCQRCGPPWACSGAARWLAQRTRKGRWLHARPAFELGVHRHHALRAHSRRTCMHASATHMQRTPLLMRCSLQGGTTSCLSRVRPGGWT